MTSSILTYTIVRTPPEGFSDAPYCVAVVSTDGRGETARISGYDGSEVEIGQAVFPLDRPDEFGATYRF